MLHVGLTAAFALIPLVLGPLSTYLYEDHTPFVWRVAAGACTASAALGLVGFLAAFALGTSGASALVALLALAFIALLIIRRDVRRSVGSDIAEVARRLGNAALKPTVASVMCTVIIAGAAALSWALLDRVLFVRGDGLDTGVMNNFGDLPFHMGVIARFANGNVPPENPIFAGVPFTYPFLADFIAAMPVAAGVSMRTAMLAQNFILLAALGVLLYQWALELTRDRLAAVVSCILTFASGGLGWWMLFGDARSGGGLFATLRHLTHDYTVLNSSTWRWGNLVTALVIPQRSLLLGLPVAITVFTLLFRDIAGRNGGSSSIRRMTAAGLIAGLLPLVHTHSFLTVMGIAVCLSLMFGWSQNWGAFFAAAMVVGLPQIAWSAHNTAMNASSFLGWQIGWDRGTENVLWFWFKNTGLFIPLLVAAFAWSRCRNSIPHRAALFYVPFTLCFIGPNLVRLAPWIWDNIKVLVYWFVASTPFVALLIAQVWRRGGLVRLVSAAVLASLTLAGALDLWRVVSRAADARLFDNEGIAFAEQIEREISPQALILHAPIHNHPVFLSGRRSFMGYPGHVWSHGLDGATREAEIREIYAGSPNASTLLAGLGIDYVVVGPVERRMLHANPAFFDRYSKVEHSGEFDLYRTASGGR